MKRILVFAFFFFASLACSAQSGTITTAYFGMQCGLGQSAGPPVVHNCPNTTIGGIPTPTWPTSLAQPGLIRLWDSTVSWAQTMTAYSGGVGTYNWNQLDGYLNSIAANEPRSVNYVFGCVPTFSNSQPGNVPPGSCGVNGNATPPLDLTSSGSPTFTQFVTDLMNHCSAAGHCVKDIITGFEFWNEANVSTGAAARWTGSQTDLYHLLKPAVAIIKAKIPGAIFFTPSITSGATPASWMVGWETAEVAGGIISNVYNMHAYLDNFIPEQLFPPGTSGSIQTDLNPNKAGTVAGWTTLPWVQGEIGYDNVTVPYSCNAGNAGVQYITNDCVGQLVRANLIWFSNGTTWGQPNGLYWYYWNTYIGTVPQFAAAYFYMMQYLVGGQITAVCASSGSPSIYTCSETEANGTAALWVWAPCVNTVQATYTTCTAGTPYTIPAGYVDYRDLAGSFVPVTAGNSLTVGVMPIMLEQGTPTVPHALVPQLFAYGLEFPLEDFSE